MKFTHVIGGSLATQDSNKSNRAQVLLHTCMVMIAFHIFKVLNTTDAALLQRKMDMSTKVRNVKGCPDLCWCELLHGGEGLRIYNCLNLQENESKLSRKSMKMLEVSTSFMIYSSSCSLNFLGKSWTLTTAWNSRKSKIVLAHTSSR